MFYECIKFEIERERIQINVWLWQPLLIFLIFMFVFISHQEKIYALYSLVFIIFPMLLIFYIYVNFLKSPNLIQVEINRNRLMMTELNNPFSRSINLSIEELERIFQSNKNWLNRNSYLCVRQKNKDIKVLKRRSFWYGKVTNESLQELLFYLQQQNSNLIIEESLNEL